ncbi:GNAT family N-acetyltransferase [Microbacterium sp. 18062]|uniref:GNAT family N-acetyltransferase n=1 Tax=Microbacterium sp. 18062 TaxID=2681410 RepID=UPI00135C4569|nr:GNAT family N-acetyltransferase [Microbacterium sp. 18062]
MTGIRAFRPGDEGDLAEICLRTADAGADASGVLTDDRIWAEVFVLPYVARHPELAFVVERDARVLGYAVAAPDTRSFEDWFHDEWWPEHGAHFARPGGNPREVGTLAYADARRAGHEPYGDTYPAHLHIDLLPEAQGQGWGRRLIGAVVDALRERRVSGLHLVASADNHGALRFYDRLGFARIPSSRGVQAFGMAL